MRHAWFLIPILLLASCGPGPILGPTFAATPLQSASPTAPIMLPTIIPITIPAACLQSVQTADWSAKVPVSCLPSPSRYTIIQVLFSVWLDHFISPNVTELYRLERFYFVSIDKVEDSPNAGFTAVVTYSVEPCLPLSSNPASWWVAGDGFPGQDGWVRGKKDNVWVTKSGDFYQMSIAPYGTA